MDWSSIYNGQGAILLGSPFRPASEPLGGELLDLLLLQSAIACQPHGPARDDKL